MGKITEAELSKRVNSLREKLISEYAAPAAPVTTPVQSGGQPADAANMANANWEYAAQGSDVSLAIDNGFGYDVAKWKAAGSPGKPKAEPKATEFEYPAEDPVQDSMTNTSNQQMAQNKAEANGVNAAGQNVSIQNPDGSITNPESGKSSIAPATPAVSNPQNPGGMSDEEMLARQQQAASTPALSPAAANAAFQQAMANSAAPAYKGSAGAQQIQSLNKDIIKDVNKIYPGQKLKMPDNSTYTVQSGDTLDKIAKGAKPAGERIDVPKQIGKPPVPVPAPAASAPRPAASAPRPAASVPKPAPAAAPVTGTDSGGGRGPTAQEFTSDWNNKMKAAQKLGWPDSTKLPPADWAPMGKPVTGKNKMAPDLKEAVTYADDQTLARIVSLSRR